jgi:hypothetical protein
MGTREIRIRTNSNCSDVFKLRAHIYQSICAFTPIKDSAFFGLAGLGAI